MQRDETAEVQDAGAGRPALDPRETARYSRHLVLPEVGLEGQLRLREASVLLVGAGGLGSPLGLYLAAAGVGRIGIVDFDAVELSNLQRQVLYTTDDVGRPKTEAARARMEGTNPHVRVEAHAARLSADNAMDLLQGYDVIVDGTDNFGTRFLVNDACVLLGKPNVYGSVFRFEGQVSVFWAGKGPCYRCLYPAPPAPGLIPNCAEGGVLGVLPGIIGTLQATETIKLILRRGESLLGRLLLFDALEMRFRELKLRRDPGCPVCGDRPRIRQLEEERVVCATPVDERSGISVEQLKQRLDREPQPLLLDVRTEQEWAICRIDGARLIPLQELPRRLSELEAGSDIVVYCHHGPRGTAALDLLHEAGFTAARNLDGGIDAWARTADPTMPRY